jgi:hypothetical protein
MMVSREILFSGLLKSCLSTEKEKPKTLCTICQGSSKIKVKGGGGKLPQEGE